MKSLLKNQSIILALILAHAGFGQSGPDTPAFEVVDIKPSKGMNPNGGKMQILPGGRLEVPNITVKSLIMAAYGVQDDMITAGPGWIGAEQFDLVAKAPPGTSRETIRMMIQPLLAERFKLVVHREESPKAVYVLVVAKGGPKMEQSSGGPEQCAWNAVGTDMIQRECHNITMSALANSMPGWGRARIDLPVVDLTGLAGTYDFKLQWSLPGACPDPARADVPSPVRDAGCTTVFDAMRQIGLALEQRKRPLSVVVIDHIERPAAN